MSSPRLIAVGLVRHGERQGQPTWIVTRRRADAHLAGSWEFPGGKVEDGESPEEALRRELGEELGIRVGEVAPLTFSHHTYGADRELLLLFFSTCTLQASPAPRPLQAASLRLLTMAELLALDMPPANAPLLSLLGKLRSLP